MSAATPDLRTAVMILVQASWEDQSGNWQTVPARMEDKSAGGACLRLSTPIAVGSKLKVRWHWSHLLGTAKYCRSDGKDYIVGIQRDKTTHPGFDGPIPRNVPVLQGVIKSTVSTSHTQSVTTTQEGNPAAIPVPERSLEDATTAPCSSTISVAAARREVDSGNNLHISQPHNAGILPPAELPKTPPPKHTEAGKEKISMAHKWLARAPWHRQDGRGPTGNGNRNAKDNHSPQAHLSDELTSANAASELGTSLPPELLPVEDIYRVAGVRTARKGYSIKKVVEMLHSEHIRGLSNDMKRAAVLMALSAAGISLDEVLADAKARQEALNSYEAEQKKQVEAEWSSKAEENVQFEAELARATAYYRARIDRNLEGVAQEKAAFGTWLTAKQLESQSILEAVELCSKSTVSPPADTRPDASSHSASAASQDKSVGDAARSTAAH